VVEWLSSVLEDIWTIGNAALITRIQAELHAVGKLEVGLGEFNSEVDINKLDIPALAKQI
jgi:hypothetical protein